MGTVSDIAPKQRKVSVLFHHRSVQLVNIDQVPVLIRMDAAVEADKFLWNILATR